MRRMPSEAPVDPGLTQSSARNGTDRALCIGFLPEKLPEGPAATPEEIPTWGNALAGTEGRSAAYAQDAIRAASARCPRRAGIDAACVLPISSPIRTSAARNSANADSCQFSFQRPSRRFCSRRFHARDYPFSAVNHCVPFFVSSPFLSRPFLVLSREQAQQMSTHLPFWLVGSFPNPFTFPRSISRLKGGFCCTLSLTT